MEKTPDIDKRQKKEKERPLILTLPGRILVVTVALTLGTVLYNACFPRDTFTMYLNIISSVLLGAAISLLCVRRLAALKKERRNTSDKQKQ